MSEAKTKDKEIKDRLIKVSTILVSQPQPSDEKSPYNTLAQKYGVRIDFRPFIQVESIGVKDFKKQKIDILAHTAIIFTSRNAVDNFFQLCLEAKIEIPAEMKYFCVS